MAKPTTDERAAPGAAVEGDWTARATEMAAALAHPLRWKILATLREREACATELSEEWGETIGKVAYHLRELNRLGYVEKVATDTRRGGEQKFYKSRSWVDPIVSAVSPQPAPVVKNVDGGMAASLSVLRAHKLLGHLVRYKMMVILCQRPVSAVDLAGEIDEFGWNLKRISDTMRELRDAGMAEFVGKQNGPKGRIRRLYRANPRRVALQDGALMVLPQEKAT